MPKLDLDSVPQTNATGYPPEHAAPVAERWYRRLAPASGLLVIGGLLAQPALALWLVSYFRHVSRLALGAAFAAFLALTSAFGVLLAGGVTPDRNLVAASGQEVTSALVARITNMTMRLAPRTPVRVVTHGESATAAA